ncbi:uncharacterized protein ASPGLDRAFT_1290753 [Aspergillus glaucus CBS 516.65]|uniref:Apple domain-containing protein n=1 Tax=Aspergillus glaucus CBS 516.65 TaxID=1160497 RepID=A0A1L9VPN8_ASPGL|nr:hypothetical protein ASPGLDRAFT_1290753 [Aspergillus glaucus CBS 516.65]OJJ85887.1 hypothetical protein ASPGLDRAFT_1290753 [Aspergillus glaucus CBS 516.65]
MVIGGAVGGGVCGTIVARNNSGSDNSAQSDMTSTSNPLTTQTPTKTSRSSTTPSTTSSALVTSGTTGMASNPCPSINGTTIQASTGSLFAVYCSVDWPKGDGAANGNGTVKDLQPYNFQYTLDDCITSCVNYNKDVGGGEKSCKAVTYAANLTAASVQGGELLS